MKKVRLFLLLFINVITLFCSSDDSNTNDDLSSNNALVGTSWEGQ